MSDAAAKNWYEMTPDEREAARLRWLERVEAAEAIGPRYCRQNEGHACSSWCGYCGRCCDCRQELDPVLESVRPFRRAK